MPPSLITEYLSASSVAALRSILGKNVWLACSPSLEFSVLDNILVAPQVILPMEENEFLVMGNDGFYDSPVAHISYYSIAITCSRTPADLDMSYTGSAASFGAGSSHVAFPNSSRDPRMRITKIEIYEEIEIYESVGQFANMPNEKETVSFDKAICLYREDGTKICLRLEDSIRAFIQILFTDAQISKGLQELSLRAQWEA